MKIYKNIWLDPEYANPWAVLFLYIHEKDVLKGTQGK